VSPLQTVILSGALPPGTSNEAITGLGSATINGNGQIAVRTVSNPTSGGGPGGIQRLYVWQAGSFAYVARSGESAINNPGAVFGTLGTAIVDETGGVAISVGTPSGGAGTGYMTYGRPGQGLRCVAQAQFTSPSPTDYPGGVGDLNTPDLSPTGAMGYAAGQQQARSMYSAAPGQPPIMRYAFGTQIPGQASGVTAGQLMFDRIDGAGNIVFAGTISGSQGVLGAGVLSAGPAGTRLVAGPGVAIPSIPGATYTHARFPTVNQSGTIAFNADFTRSSPSSSSSGLFTMTGNTSTLVAEIGQNIPGMAPTITMASIEPAALSKGGRVYFRGSVQNAAVAPPSITRNIIFASDQAGLHRAFGVGDSVAGGATGSILAGLDTTSDDAFAINNLGQAVFTGFLNQNGTFPRAILSYLPGEGLRAIATIGGSLTVGPGDVRTISSLLMHSSLTSGALVGLSGDDGMGSPLNDSGQLVFRASFTDGSSGLFTTTIPAPGASTVVLAAAGIGCLRRERRSIRD
jgi:hypothetical protein